MLGVIPDVTEFHLQVELEHAFEFFRLIEFFRTGGWFTAEVSDHIGQVLCVTHFVRNFLIENVPQFSSSKSHSFAGLVGVAQNRAPLRRQIFVKSLDQLLLCHVFALLFSFLANFGDGSKFATWEIRVPVDERGLAFTSAAMIPGSLIMR